jgi:hypothetical protein
MAIAQTPSPLSNIISSKTYNALWYQSTGDTSEVAISKATAAAATDGAPFVYIPAALFPYNIGLVTTNPAVSYVQESSVLAGYGTPEGVYAAPIGFLYQQLDGANGATLWKKNTGTGTTGWVLITTSGTALVDFQKTSANFPEETYYIAANVPALASGNPAINRLQFLPFFVSVKTTIDKIAFVVISGGGAGSVARCGLYNADQTTLKPTTLIVDGGEQSTGQAGIKFTAVSQILLPGVLYFGAYFAGTSAPAISIYSNTSTPFFGFFNGGTALFTRYGWYLDQAYSALPADVSASTFLSLDAGRAPAAVFYRILSTS